MFDVGFSEIFIIGIVALIVLGPERLPKVARTAGHLLGRLQRYVSDVKADINREIQLEELKKLQADVSESARKIEDQVRGEFESARNTIEGGTRTALSELESTAQLVSQPAEPAPGLAVGTPPEAVGASQTPAPTEPLAPAKALP